MVDISQGNDDIMIKCILVSIAWKLWWSWRACSKAFDHHNTLFLSDTYETPNAFITKYCAGTKHSKLDHLCLNKCILCSALPKAYKPLVTRIFVIQSSL